MDLQIFSPQELDAVLRVLRNVALANDRGQRLAKRVALMAWWGDALELAEAGKTVPALIRHQRYSNEPSRAQVS